ncbi:MAG: CehA/McbA family metallohydrolase [Planctomycetota bacterium]
MPKSLSSLTRLFIAFALVFGLAGCEDSSGGSSASVASAPGSASTGSTATQPLPLNWLRGDLHNHSNYTVEIAGTGDSPEVNLRLAEAVGLDFLSLTDHRNHQGTLDPAFVNNATRVIAIPGEEWGINSTGHGGVQGVFTDIPDLVDRTQPMSTWNSQVQATVDAVHAQGGLFIINHPTSRRIPWTWNVSGADGVEVWNTFWALHSVVDLDEATVWDKVGTAFRSTGHSPDPALLAAARQPGPGKRRQAVNYYESLLARGERVACVGGGDRHLIFLPGNPTTHVGVLSPDVQGVLEGIKACRTYVTAHADGPEVSFTADGNDDGVFETTMGGEVRAGQTAHFRVKVSNTPGGRIELRRSGLVVAAVEAQSGPVELYFTDIPAAGDWYRVDYFEPIDTTIPGGSSLLTVALSSSIQDPDWTSFTFYRTVLAALAALPHVQNQVTQAFQTSLPVIIIPREYNRILNADPQDTTRSVAAITSPIFTSR